MSMQTVKDFDRMAASDDGLRRKLQDAGTGDDLRTIAQDAGFEFSAQDVDEYLSEIVSSELSDEELESVAGGAASPAALLANQHPFAGAFARTFGALGVDAIDSCWIVRGRSR